MRAGELPALARASQGAWRAWWRPLHESLGRPDQVSCVTKFAFSMGPPKPREVASLRPRPTAKRGQRQASAAGPAGFRAGWTVSGGTASPHITLVAPQARCWGW